MSIRAREPADLPGCVAVLRRVHELSGYPVVWPADPARWLTPSGLIRAWVACRDGAITGQVGLTAGAPDPCLIEATGREDGQLAGIARLYVDPAARGAGLGGELLDVAAGWARAAGLLPTLDVVDDAGPAIALYERAGWRLAGTGLATWKDRNGELARLRYYVSPPAA
jgi:GNAT superfamily N-acetyltransferase